MKVEMPIYGGLAGDDLQMDSTYVFTEGRDQRLMFLAVIFDTENRDEWVSSWRLETPWEQ
ncbi:MAG: hypothetical protein R3B93_29005 [Bacteroidia bacterium]